MPVGARKGRTAVDQRCRRRPAIYCGWNSAERRSGVPLVSWNASDLKFAAGDWNAGGAGAGAGPIHAATNFIDGETGTPGGDAAGVVWANPAAGTGAANAAADGAGAGHRALLCDGDAGFDSGAGGSSGHGGAGGTDERSLPADDGIEPDQRGRAAICGGVSGSGRPGLGGSEAARSGGRSGFRTSGDGVEDGGGRGANETGRQGQREGRGGQASELDAEAVAGTEWRDSVRDCERPGCDRTAGDGGSAAVERRALPGDGGEQPGICIHLLDGRASDGDELIYRRDAGLSCGCAGGADGDGADGRDGSGEVPGMPADAGDAGGVAGGIADSAQRRGVSPDRVAQPADAIAGRADVCVEPRHGRDGTARGRRGASPGDAAAGVDSGVSGRRDLWNRP